MGIFEEETLTKQEKLNLLNEEIKRKSKMSLLIFQDRQKEIFNKIWYNEEFTPQEVFDTFGNETIELFIASAKSEQLQKDLLGDDYTELVVPYNFTLNEDGTVTVGDKIV